MIDIKVDPVEDAVISLPYDPETENARTSLADIDQRMNANGMTLTQILGHLAENPIAEVGTLRIYSY